MFFTHRQKVSKRYWLIQYRFGIFGKGLAGYERLAGADQGMVLTVASSFYLLKFS